MDIKKWISGGILLLVIPAVILFGNRIFGAKQYAFISLATVILACIPFFLSFEKTEQSTVRLVLIAAMTSLSVLGRLVFAAIPGFKPVTALVILTAMYFGPQAGYLTGALSAALSNFYFGQGPWTPFQMFTWGLIGFFAGLAGKRLKSNRFLLCVCGAVSGVVYSLVMDTWTVLWWDGTFQVRRYLAAISSSAGFMMIYACSNVIFLLLLASPIGKKLERMKIKYGI